MTAQIRAVVLNHPINGSDSNHVNYQGFKWEMADQKKEIELRI